MLVDGFDLFLYNVDKQRRIIGEIIDNFVLYSCRRRYICYQFKVNNEDFKKFAINTVYLYYIIWPDNKIEAR